MTNIMLPQPHKIISVVKETKAEYTFRVEYDGHTEHGQFFQLSIPKIGEAPISVSGLGEGYLEFTIRKIGRLTNGIFGLNAGDMLFMRGPYGKPFPVDEFNGKDLVVICGGTGMAAVKTLLQHFRYHKDEVKSLHIIAGFRDCGSVLFAEELEALKSCFNTIATLDNCDAAGFEAGMVTDHIFKIPFQDFEDYNVVIVGPPAMMNAAAQECISNGAVDHKIWVSFERKMSCAVGKCGHCKINETYVCLEGPVFNYSIAKELFD